MTLAHELAHRVLIADPDMEEKAATRFGSAFLMPAKSVRNEMGSRRKGVSCQEILVLKRVYRVSAAALLMRLREIDIISQNQLTRTFKGKGRTWRQKEPDPLEKEQQRLERPRRFERLCYRALAEDQLSVGRAAVLLGKSVIDVEKDMTGRE